MAGRDPYACCTACLQPHIARWCARHPDTHVHRAPHARPGATSLGACTGVSVRTINRVLAVDQPTTDLATADLLLAGIDRADILQVECEPWLRVSGATAPRGSWQPGMHAPGCPLAAAP